MTMTARIDRNELSPPSALEMLRRWASIHGPDPRTKRGNSRRGTLGLYRLPTYRRHDETGRSTAPSNRYNDRANAGPHDAVGVTTIWSANAPPGLPSA